MKIIILGATSGIGRELALRYAGDPANTVSISGRRESLLSEISTQFPAIQTDAFDLTAPNRLDSLEKMIDRLGGVDLLIISAGYGKINPELDWVPTEQTLMLNVVAFTAISDFMYHYFTRQGHGQLVEIASVAGLRGLDNCSGYSASKAYNIRYMEGLKRKSVKEKSPIVLTTLLPGFVDTDLAKGDYFWKMSVEVAAKSIMNAIRRKKTVAYITARWRLIGWLMKCAPDFLFNRF